MTSDASESVNPGGFGGRLALREPVFEVSADGERRAPVPTPTDEEILAITVEQFLSMTDEERQDLTRTLDPQVYSPMRRESWSFEEGATTCEIRGCDDSGRVLVGSYPGHRLVLCDGGHDELETSDGFITGPTGYFPEYARLTRLMHQARGLPASELDLEEVAQATLCVAKGCPAIGGCLFGRLSFCLFHEAARDSAVAALLTCESCGRWNPPPVDLASQIWDWPPKPPVRTDASGTFALVWGYVPCSRCLGNAEQGRGVNR